MSKLKEFLKRFIPVPIKTFHVRVDNVENKIIDIKNTLELCQRVQEIETKVKDISESEHRIHECLYRLEDDIKILSNTHRKLVDDPLQKIISEYKYDIWKLKDVINTLPDDDTRSLYLDAYHLILAEKGAWIGYTSRFLTKPIFPHSYFGVFVSNSAIIGKNVVIFQQVTIGSNSLVDSQNNGAPIIGDNVYIGAGAKIIGKIKIGNNCRIGANAVVVTDVPDDSVVVMTKPRILHKTYMDNKFYNIQNGQLGYHLDGEFHVVDEKE